MFCSILTRNSLSRGMATVSAFSPLRALGARNTNMKTLSISQNFVLGTPELDSVGGLFQRRWKSRGNTYQPSTLKRKRRFGFLSRMATKEGRKIVGNRKQKGRWYLTH